MNASLKITKLSDGEAEEAGQTLARAFHDDPPFVHFVPEAAQRVRVLSSFFSRFARYGMVSGEVQGTADRRGIAIWLSQEHASSKLATLAGLDQLSVIFGDVGFARLSAFLTFMEKLHHDSMAATHWYLAFIGVDPTHQGKGVGTALLKPMLDRAEAEALPCYLETFLARNVPFYRKNGFNLLSEGVEPSSKCQFWTFARDPKSGGLGETSFRRPQSG
ncbi:MAG TPA: GNAT family N-acetyltransferase [Candidatus Binataceae bacterium]|nr:GNAT family N-acetyltransferase [Candidatus Binataceae bacterium]